MKSSKDANMPNAKKIPSSFKSPSVLKGKYIAPGAGERMAMTILPPSDDDAATKTPSAVECKEQNKPTSNLGTTESTIVKKEEVVEDSKKKKKKAKKKNGLGKDKHKRRTTNKKRPTTTTSTTSTTEASSKVVSVNFLSEAPASTVGKSAITSSLSTVESVHHQQSKKQLSTAAASVAPVGNHMSTSSSTSNPKPKKKPSKSRNNSKHKGEENEGEWIKGGQGKNEDRPPQQRPSQQKEKQHVEKQQQLSTITPVVDVQQTSQTEETPWTVANSTYGDDDATDHRSVMITRVKKRAVADFFSDCCCC